MKRIIISVLILALLVTPWLGAGVAAAAGAGTAIGASAQESASAAGASAAGEKSGETLERTDDNNAASAVGAGTAGGASAQESASAEGAGTANEYGTGLGQLAARIELVRTGRPGERLTFTAEDFTRAFAIGDFNGITITALPSAEDGTLIHAGRRVRSGEYIKRKHIGSLLFVPTDGSVTGAQFEFILDGAGIGATTVCRMIFTERANRVPRVAGDELVVSAMSGVKAVFRISATDPDGDGLDCIIISHPRFGAARSVEGDPGKIEYTPRADYVGTDGMTVVFRDGCGGYSEAVKIEIKISPRISEVVYADMTGRSEYAAAIAMSAIGVMNGRKSGGVSYFDPDVTVTRAEFVAMALTACGIRPSGVGISFFDDDRLIPRALLPYVAYAARCGIVDGDFGEDGLVFRPNDPITLGEAAMIMARLIGVDGRDAADGSLREEEIFGDIPVYAASSVYAMITLGIFDADGDMLSSSMNGADGAITITDRELSRATVAECLYRLIRLG